MKKYFLLWAGLSLSGAVSAQQIPDWQNKDLKKDSLFGISTHKAFDELLNGKKSNPVIVAVIDAGVDTSHEDLKNILWVNPRKKSGDNGTFGWSYIGSAKGNVQLDNLELTRQIRQQQQKGDTNTVAYHKEKAELDKKLADDTKQLQGVTKFASILKEMMQKIGKADPKLADFQAYQPQGTAETRVRQTLIAALSQKDNIGTFQKDQLGRAIEHYQSSVDYQLNVAYDPRDQYVGDNYLNSEEHNYGSPDNNGPDPTHGTHVAGIIAAQQNNGIGIDGIADHVKILAVRAVPDGDERDKDIANAIRYAADHGAKIINMSFGKPYSQDKKVVDDAVKYALKKDVLLVQAAGNDDQDIDTAANFPNRNYANGGEAGAWIVVGASGLKDNDRLKAPFSNYGKTAVDVFAPGVQIYSSVPGSKYAYFDGTSMACPVVVGLAALIREYYPRLKAQQVKDIILQSVVKVEHPVLLDKKEVPFTELCRTGGIVNAYRALQLAATYR